MKRIEFIAPVAAMRGNLSGRQTLVYAENDNKAFDAPQDKRNYARNYSPRFIGAKRAKDGHTYFATKTKSATTTSVNTMTAMAAMGAAAAYYACLIKDLPKRNRLEQIYATFPAGTFKSLREFVYTRGLYWMFKDKQLQFTINPAAGSELQPLSLENPFNGDATASGVPANYPAAILVKFWRWLGFLQDGGEPTMGTINGQTYIGFQQLTWEELIENNVLNILGLSSKEQSGETYVTLNGLYVYSAEGAGESIAGLANGRNFTLSNTPD